MTTNLERFFAFLRERSRNMETTSMTHSARGSTCFCRVSFYRGGRERWVVLERKEKGSLIYCKSCRCEWRSSRKYVEKLEDWKKQTRGTVTDDEILCRLFELENLRIDSESAVVESLATRGPNANKGWQILQQVADSHDSGYRFVNVSFGGRKRKIAVHVLQWMAAHRRSVPDDHDVDHIVSPPRPEEKNNALSNLRIVRSYLNQARQPDQQELPF